MTCRRVSTKSGERLRREPKALYSHSIVILQNIHIISMNYNISIVRYHEEYHGRKPSLAAMKFGAFAFDMLGFSYAI